MSLGRQLCERIMRHVRVGGEAADDSLPKYVLSSGGQSSMVLVVKVFDGFKPAFFHVE